MRRLIVTLLTATMVLPTMAAAQDRGERRSRAEGTGGPAAGPATGEARQRPWRDQMQPAGGGADDARRRFDRTRDRAVDQPRPDQPRPEQPRPDQTRPDQPRPAPRQDDGRGNDGRGNDGRWNAGARPDRNGAGWSRGGGDDGRRDGIGGRDTVDPRRDGPRPNGDPRWNDRQGNDRQGDGRYDGRRNDAPRYDGRRLDGRRDDDGRRWTDSRGGSAWYSDRDNGNRGGWNRGWRADTRYDWARYRTANRNAYRLPRYYAPSGWGGGYRRFGIGATLSSGLWGQNYWIGDPFAYRLPEAYGPYRWVRYFGDALLIDLRTGLVVDSVYDIFW